MVSHIMKCGSCGKYTMKAACDKCSTQTTEARPPKYSPEDKYGHLRRQVKEESYKEKGLI